MSTASEGCLRYWRCFHCDEVFLTKREAALHFGADETTTPACRIASHEGHLVTRIRALEEQLARYWSEDQDVLRSIQVLEADHRAALIREEERGYARGVRDGAADVLAANPTAIG